MATTARTAPPTQLIFDLAQLRATDTLLAGGKGANLGELLSFGMLVPAGFVISSTAWTQARDENQIAPRLQQIFEGLDHRDDRALARACDLAVAVVSQLKMSEPLQRAILDAREELLRETPDAPVIVRSSATLEDSASASFAGMNETYANVTGAQATLEAVRLCWASLFARRTVFYRAERGMPVAGAELAVVVQRYVPATSSGIMFTGDPSQQQPTITIEATVGGGSAIVAGHVTPDRFVVDPSTWKIAERAVHAKERQVVDDSGGGTHEEAITGQAATDSLGDRDVLRIARRGAEIARHYGSAQDIEWLIDPHDELWIVQSRPVTASLDAAAPPTAASPAAELLRGVPASAGRAAGAVRILSTPDGEGLAEGEILVAQMTSPDWAPLMRRAAAIVTDAGGMTCHAAIVAREMGVPCVVGTGDATSTLHDGQLVTVDGRAGVVLAGRVQAPDEPARVESPAERRPSGTTTGTAVLVNLSDLTQVEQVAALPCDGVGLLRAETMIVDALGGEHPLALVEQGRAEEAATRLAKGIEQFLRAFAPRPVTYRTSDFRTNEFRRLRGGERFEPVEENPMVGFRGAGRYADQPQVLEIEARALATMLERGHTNLRVMLPFVRTPRDVAACDRILAEAGLTPGDGFELWVMAEVPSVLHYLSSYRDMGITGISIGTNDLTQLLLGADRDSELLAGYDATDPAVTSYIEELLDVAAALGLSTSICGQAPAVYPSYVNLLVRSGIDSISVTPDALDVTRAAVEREERRLLLAAARG